MLAEELCLAIFKFKNGSNFYNLTLLGPCSSYITDASDPSSQQFGPSRQQGNPQPLSQHIFCSLPATKSFAGAIPCSHRIVSTVSFAFSYARFFPPLQQPQYLPQSIAEIVCKKHSYLSPTCQILQFLNSCLARLEALKAYDRTQECHGAFAVGNGHRHVLI